MSPLCTTRRAGAGGGAGRPLRSAEACRDRTRWLDHRDRTGWHRKDLFARTGRRRSRRRGLVRPGGALDQVSSGPQHLAGDVAGDLTRERCRSTDQPVLVVVDELPTGDAVSLQVRCASSATDSAACHDALHHRTGGQSGNDAGRPQPRRRATAGSMAAGSAPRATARAPSRCLPGPRPDPDRSGQRGLADLEGTAGRSSLWGSPRAPPTSRRSRVPPSHDTRALDPAAEGPRAA